MKKKAVRKPPKKAKEKFSDRCGRLYKSLFPRSPFLTPTENADEALPEALPQGGYQATPQDQKAFQKGRRRKTFAK